ncbi:hypothetical protein N7468_008250 [Penicillium chermesinum]|uniref:Hydrophobin n=1 Tax=Penicillium chermesinum TaxID=63820 RepID=A0A9W9NPV1_9EURO|nr:uncharacterized protein N7468_008250 [Penicillium chermesinum]KAJ5223708.1 hypothetical protein N7468_008250 [Penicillium chermesinum]
MRLIYLLAPVATICTFGAAIPLASSQGKSPTPTPTPTKALASASTPRTNPAMPSQSMVGAYQCPQNQFKRCCQSLQETSKEIMKGLGDLVPIVGGIQISSKISFQCDAMSDATAPDDCQGHGFIPMCCSNDTSNGVGSCKPFEIAKEDYYRSFGYNEQEESPVDTINDVMY